MKLDRIIAVRNKKTIYRDGTQCIKVFNEDYSKSDVFSEALNRTIIEETGLNVPKVLEVTTIDGKWAIVSEYIKGKTLAQLIKEDDEKKDEYIELLVNLQLEVLKKNSPLLAKLRDKMNDEIRKSELDATARYDLHTRLDGMPKHTKLCHGDFNPTNIVIAEDGTPYIVDWEQATQGNASADAARTYLLFWLEGDMTGAEKYLELFCEKSGIAKQYVQKWMPLVAAAQSVEGNEKEREFLLSWVNVVEY